MGKLDTISQKEFTSNDVANKELVLQMLQFEEAFTKSEKGQDMYQNEFNNPLTSLTIEKAINRITLTEFGFSSSDASVDNYRTIFKTYFRTPDDYDKDVINSSHYMRNNKCVFYKNKPLKIGDVIPNCNLTTLDNTSTTLYDAIAKENAKITMVGAFSLS